MSQLECCLRALSAMANQQTSLIWNPHALITAAREDYSCKSDGRTGISKQGGINGSRFSYECQRQLRSVRDQLAIRRCLMAPRRVAAITAASERSNGEPKLHPRFSCGLRGPRRTP